MSRAPNLNATASFSEEHLHLREAIVEFHSVLTSRASSPRHAMRLLRDLPQQVLEHFEHEERVGYFTEAIDAAPRLSERAAALLLRA